MLVRKHPFFLEVVILNVSIFHTNVIYPAQQSLQAQVEQIVKTALKSFKADVDILHQTENNTVLVSNESLALAHNANGIAIEAGKEARSALTLANEVTTGLTQAQQLQAIVTQDARTAAENLEHVV